MNETTTFTKSELFTAYNKMRAAMRRAGDVKGLERLNKALGILQSKAYYQGERGEYLPTLASCGCKDWEYRNAKRRAYTGACKHMLAESLLLMIVENRRAHEVTSWVEARHVLESSYRA